MASSRTKILVFWVVLVIASLAVAEAGLQVLSLVVSGPTTNATVPATIPDTRLGCRGNPAYRGHDARGFRNSEALRSAEIVALGDSQTYGFGVLPEHAWPARLSTIIQLTTYSMALGSYGPTHALLLLEEALGLGPKVVIEAFYLGNDLYDSYAHVYRAGQLSDLKSHAPAVLRALEEAERAGSIEAKAQLLFDRALLWHTRAPAFVDGWGEQIQLVRLTRQLKQRWNDWHDRPQLDRRQFDEPFWATIVQEAQRAGEDRIIFQHEDLRTVFTPLYRLCALDRNDARIGEGLRISLDAIGRMHEQVTAARARFLVVLIPTKERAFLEAAKRSGWALPAPYTALIDSEEAISQRAEEFLRERGIRYVDLRLALESVLRRGGQPYPVSWDGHPNEAGHLAMAVAVASALAEQGLN